MTLTSRQGAAAPRRSRRPGLIGQVIEHRWDYLYILPALGVMMVVIAYPIWFTVQLSFYKTPANLQLKDAIWDGVHNYQLILKSRSFHAVTMNTMIWSFSCTIFAFILGTAAALALHREFAGRGVMRALLLIPYVVSAVAASYVWKWLYHSDFGVIGAASVELGLTQKPINFLDNITTVLPSLIVVQIWREFSFAMIMMMAGLQTVPDQLLRAAQVDGANTWQRFLHVTMPHLKGVTMVTLLLLLVNNFNNFVVPYIMTGGGPAGASDIWVTQIFTLAFGRQKWGIASAYSVILFIVMMTLGYFYVKALTRGDDTRPGD